METRLDSSRIGFIGLGIMGAPMAANLLRAGHALTVYNRSERPAVAALVAAGARRAATPREAAAGAAVIITMVTDTADVEAVILGEQGVIEGAAAGSTVIDMSTISPAATRRIAARLGERGVAMLDAPVSGGELGARNATLAIMVGGPAEVLARCRAVLQSLGKTITLVGDHGAGQTAKLCNQVAGALNNLAVAEALTLAAASGLDPGRVLEAIAGGAAGSWMMSNFGPRILARDFAPGFMVDLQQKDLRLVLEAANELGVALPGVSLVHQWFNAVQRAGLGREGTQALVKAYEMQHGLQVGA